MAHLIPASLDADLIGSVVSLQTFERNPAGDSILSHTLDKMTGILESFRQTPGVVQFKFVGQTTSILVRDQFSYYELYVLSMPDPNAGVVFVTPQEN